MFLMDNITATLTKYLTSETTFTNYLLIVYAYSKIPKNYGMERIPGIGWSPSGGGRPVKVHYC